jgi:hypothetical protein
MRIVSGLSRLIAGLGVMGMALYVHLANQPQMEGRAEVTMTIAGLEIVATPAQMHLALVTAAMIGALLVALGVATLVRKPKPAPLPAAPPPA